jgi:hypothetical protein
MKPHHLERLRDLYAMIAGMPLQNLDLDTWRSGLFNLPDNSERVVTAEMAAHTCNTTGCAVGWACAYPKFREQGLRYLRDNSGFEGPALVNEAGVQVSHQWDAVRQFFGVSMLEAKGLFLSCPDHYQMRAVGVNAYMQRDLSNKRRVLLRIRSLLLKKGHITQARSDELAMQETCL